MEATLMRMLFSLPTNLQRSLPLLLGLVVCTCVAPQVQATEAALSQLNEALAQISTYDVTYRIDITTRVQSRENSRTQIDPGNEYDPSELAKPGETRELIETYRIRHVLDVVGRERVEYFDKDFKVVRLITVSDGVFRCRYEPALLRAVFDMQEPGGPPLASDSISPDLQYSQLLGSLFLGGDLPTLLKARKNLVTSRRAGIIDLSTAPEQGNFYPKFGWRVTLEERYGWMPTRQQVYYGGMDALHSTIQANSYHEIARNVFVPLEGERKMFGPNGDLLQQIRIKVDLPSSRWNHALDDGDFVVELPTGTTVIDHIDHVRFKVQQKRASDELELLREEGVRKISIRPRQ